MKVRVASLILAGAMVPAICATSLYGRHDLIVLGRVVAYDQLSSLMDITTAPRLEVVIVRIDKRIQGREDSRYVQVRYRHLGDDTRLPSEVFDSKNRWRFVLVRDNSCDASFRVLQHTKVKPADETEISLPHFKPTVGAETEEIPLDQTLPCYLLRPGALKSVGSLRISPSD